MIDTLSISRWLAGSQHEKGNGKTVYMVQRPDMSLELGKAEDENMKQPECLGL